MGLCSGSPQGAALGREPRTISVSNEGVSDIFGRLLSISEARKKIHLSLSLSNPSAALTLCLRKKIGKFVESSSPFIKRGR